MKINQHSFLRVATASPQLKVADCDYNVSQIKTIITQAIENDVQLLCFPELCITGSTCGDLFFQSALQEKAKESLVQLVDFLKEKPSITVVVGLPLMIHHHIYNAAAILCKDDRMKIVLKVAIPDHQKRWFSSITESFNHTEIQLNNLHFGVHKTSGIIETSIGNVMIDIGENWCFPISLSPEKSEQCVNIIIHLSAGKELIGKNEKRIAHILQQSARRNAAYMYASAGVGESTTDAVFSGACFIADNGTMLAESKRFSFKNELVIANMNPSVLQNERPHSAYLTDNNVEETTLNPHPFIPTKEKEDETFSDIFNIQTHGLAKRLRHTGIKHATIGVSGGLDSTLALLVTVKAFDLIGLPRKNIHGITMPGFGTTNRTHTNAILLMKALGITIKEISIVETVTQHLKNIGHDINTHNIVYENAQARERTQILMDYANKINGIVIGTGNLSELALGWATYNGDHISMYAVNAGVPKTLVSALTLWMADKETDETTQKVLQDILHTPFSPELLPTNDEGIIAQKTEDFVGPYELHDFFLYRMLRYGDNPRHIHHCATQAFAEKYTSGQIKKWLKVFLTRFFSQQFKRSCMPDGPQVVSITLSPRGGWCMPSDAVAKVWLDELDNIND